MLKPSSQLIYAVGVAAGYEPLRDWFKCLYETLLGQEQGPRMGSFFKLYGYAASLALIEAARTGQLADGGPMIWPLAAAIARLLPAEAAHRAAVQALKSGLHPTTRPAALPVSVLGRGICQPAGAGPPVLTRMQRRWPGRWRSVLAIWRSAR